MIVKENSVAILGYHDGSAGQIETWFESVTGLHIACFVHESADSICVNIENENRKRVSQRTSFPENGLFKGRPLMVSINWINELKNLGINKVLPLTPDNRMRKKQIDNCHCNGLNLVSAIHPTVSVLPGAIIAPGVWINAGCIIGYKAEVFSGVLINTGVKIDHHNVIESCCQIDPGVVTAGNVTLRTCCHVHTGATIINRIEVGENSIIGAGAVVINNIPKNATAFGVPARIVRCN